ncbi:hypothetical protein [Sandarakinorhabdus oryzae]|uniref:hypothetical protein n=1 Tax=Sandarakinorhabdus oryzae TaxID=2675220 RepID=UPI0012E131BF|nr:hypothetical protein [Sandarakinorhabdus oryzae]
MTAANDDNMFSLSDVHPGFSGKLILECKGPLISGLSSLRAKLANKRFAVFDHVTEFDYDGVLTSVECVRGFDDRAAAERFIVDRVSEFTTERLEDPRWKQAPVQPREVNVLPATGNLMPGRYPKQSGFAAFRASEYETAYLRLYIVENNGTGDLTEQILSFDGIQDDIVRYLMHRE